MKQEALTSTQEQAFIITADALQEGSLTALLTAFDPLLAATIDRKDNGLPPIHVDTQSRQARNSSQRDHLADISSNRPSRAIIPTIYSAHAAEQIRQKNARLQERYGVDGPEHMIRIAIELRDLPLAPTTKAPPSQLDERHIVIGGLLSHGLSAYDIHTALGISQLNVNEYIHTWRTGLRAIDSVNAVAQSFRLGMLGCEAMIISQEHTGRYTNIVPARPLSQMGLLPRLQRLFGSRPERTETTERL